MPKNLAKNRSTVLFQLHDKAHATPYWISLDFHDIVKKFHVPFSNKSGVLIQKSEHLYPSSIFLLTNHDKKTEFNKLQCYSNNRLNIVRDIRPSKVTFSWLEKNWFDVFGQISCPTANIFEMVFSILNSEEITPRSYMKAPTLFGEATIFRDVHRDGTLYLPDSFKTVKLYQSFSEIVLQSTLDTQFSRNVFVADDELAVILSKIFLPVFAAFEKFIKHNAHVCKKPKDFAEKLSNTIYDPYRVISRLLEALALSRWIFMKNNGRFASDKCKPLASALEAMRNEEEHSG